MIKKFKDLGHSSTKLKKFLIMFSILLFLYILFRLYIGFYGCIDCHIIYADRYGNPRTEDEIRFMLAMKTIGKYLLGLFSLFGIYLSYLLFPKKD